jgi:glucose-6-phosphate 1-dehydrogenase
MPQTRNSGAVVAENARGNAEPFILVIFGASGDLTQRKLIPALYGLLHDGLLPERFAVVGFARREKSDDAFREELRGAVNAFSRLRPIDDALWRRLAGRIFYHQGDYADRAAFTGLAERLRTIGKDLRIPENHLFYLATPPDVVAGIVESLREAGLSRRGDSTRPWSRLIAEKPFGRDQGSARALNALIHRAFTEDQVFRIDHYLGKETVQNILVFRFANSIFEPLWNQKYVDHVQITVAETLGMERRGPFFDKAGAVRDVVQNHMMQLLALVAMEPAVGLDAVSVRNEKVKVLKSLRPMDEGCALRSIVIGRYARGTVAGKPAPAYLEEEGVDPKSVTETYVAFKAFIDNWRWAEVPFYLRTGKRLAERVTEVAIHFKGAPRVLFNRDAAAPLCPNLLTLRIQPDEGVSLRFEVKTPGQTAAVRAHQMDFSYRKSFGTEPPEAYERLLLDAALGDAALFIRNDEVDAAWRFVDPLLAGCREDGERKLCAYAAGSWGPAEADDLLERDGRAWEIAGSECG